MMEQNGEGSGGIPKRRRSVRFRIGLVAACLLTNAGQAIASDLWEEAAGGAVAILPPPMNAKMIVGGSLACREQQWSLRLRTGPGARAQDGPATLVVDGDEFAAFSELNAGIATIGVTREMLSAINEGNRLSIMVEGGMADLSLRIARGVRGGGAAVQPRRHVGLSAHRAGGSRR
ncbi:MAG: hypothetical protein H0T56_16930 [Pseudaminobacter sp.]|nr:hypothetical protein [Pseudaminobacter sp.]